HQAAQPDVPRRRAPDGATLPGTPELREAGPLRPRPRHPRGAGGEHAGNGSLRAGRRGAAGDPARLHPGARGRGPARGPHGHGGRAPLLPGRRSPPTGRPKLMGVPRFHFGAFFSREARENDYLWGRLDGAEQLIRLILGDESVGYAPEAFQAILREEGDRLTGVRPLVEHLRM